MKVKLRWVSITPLGLPVVPEVKISEATVSGACLRPATSARSLLDRSGRQLEHLLERPDPRGQPASRSAARQAAALLEQIVADR